MNIDEFLKEKEYKNFFLGKKEKECPEHGKYLSALLPSREGNFFSSCPECVTRRSKLLDKARAMQDHQEYVIRVGRIEKKYINTTFDDFKPISRTKSKQQSEILQLCKRFVEYPEESLHIGKSGLFFGNCGNGKTILAISMVKAFLNKGINATYLRFSNIMETIYRSFDKNYNFPSKDTAMFDDIKKIPFLVIDEVSGGPYTEDANYRLFTLLSDRIYEQKSTLLIANDMPNISKLIDERIISRFKEFDFIVTFDWEDMRDKNNNPYHWAHKNNQR